jgi:hypothetical protein
LRVLNRGRWVQFDGKQRVRANALKHGLSARTLKPLTEPKAMQLAFAFEPV